MDFLIIDLTHGGVIIANALAELKTLDLSSLNKNKKANEYSDNNNGKDKDNAEKENNDKKDNNKTNYKNEKNEHNAKNNRNQEDNFIAVNRIFAFDIYNTYNGSIDSNKLNKLHSEIILINDIQKLFNYNINNLIIISPVHCNFKVPNAFNNIKNSYLTHHEAINLILSQKNPIANNIIEVTGVKGKTSVVGILEKILKNNSLLILSSLGAKTINKNDESNENNKNETILKKNISITPASIIETINLAKSESNKNNNNTSSSNNNDNDNNTNINEIFDIAIFESSLGGTGNANIGVLTNIAENYSIANNSKTASDAKRQIFNSDIVVCEYETLNSYYKEYLPKKSFKANEGYKINTIVNTFSIYSNNANLTANKINYDLDETNIGIKFNNIKTINNKEISGDLDIKVFAIGKHHVSNVLAAITTGLTLEIDINQIKNNIINFKGLKGRSSKAKVNNIEKKTPITIIEEINPGINVKAIESSIEMLGDLSNYTIIIGGDYGITCEEINEAELATFLNKLISNSHNTSTNNGNTSNNNGNTNNNNNMNNTRNNNNGNSNNIDDNNSINVTINENKSNNIILTGQLGKNLNKKLDKKLKYIENPIAAKKEAIHLKKDILFIFRSNYSQVDKR
ncbi:MAG: coenzyme F430 synthase [Methanobacteriaceae archaeon]